jgi:peptide/nickel transport system substrate-binding protein
MATNRWSRYAGLGIALMLMLSLVVGVVNAQDEKVLVIGWDQEPGQLNPLIAMVQATNLEEFYARDVWNWDFDRNIYPVMVQEIPTIENGLVTTTDAGNTVVTYKLRPDMKWSDGEPITADDCLFWHKIHMDASTSVNFTRGNYPNYVEGMEKIDDLTFVLTYNRPVPDYLTDTSLYARCSYPAHILQPVLDAEGTIDRAPYFTGQGTVGYGPYVLESWTVGDNITFVRNQYWDGQAPEIDKIIIKFIPDSAQMENALSTGEIDLSFLWAETQLESYSNMPGVTIWSEPGVLSDALWFNMTDKAHPALQDVKVRQAIGYALDRRAMADGLAGGADLPKAWWFEQWQPDDLTIFDYNVDMANQLLDEAGWVDSNGDGTRDKDGQELILRFYTTTRQQRIDYQILIQEYLTAVGIGTQLFPIPSGPLFAPFGQRGILLTYDYDMAQFGLTADPLSPGTQDSFACDQVASPENPQGGSNIGWCDEEFDRLDELVNTTVDPVKRLEYHHEAEHIANDATFYIGLFLRRTNYALNTDRWDVESFKGGGTLSGNYFERTEFWKSVS